MRSSRMPLFTAALVATLVTLAAGCAYYGANLRVGVSTEADVLRDMGAAAETYDHPDGSRQLAFPRGPYGEETFMARISRDGRLLGFEQVLNEEHYQHIIPGRTRLEEVRKLIGPPSETMEFPRLDQHSWTYRFQDRWRRTADFSVTFDRSGLVVKTIAIQLDSSSGIP